MFSPDQLKIIEELLKKNKTIVLKLHQQKQELIIKTMELSKIE